MTLWVQIYQVSSGTRNACLPSNAFCRLKRSGWRVSWNTWRVGTFCLRNRKIVRKDCIATWVDCTDRATTLSYRWNEGNQSRTLHCQNQTWVGYVNRASKPVWKLVVDEKCAFGWWLLRTGRLLSEKVKSVLFAKLIWLVFPMAFNSWGMCQFLPMTVLSVTRNFLWHFES